MQYLEIGDFFGDFVGPLGCASELVGADIEELKKKKIVFIDVAHRRGGDCACVSSGEMAA